MMMYALSPASPVTVRDALTALGIDPRPILAVRCGSRLLEMNETLCGPHTVSPLTLKDEEGRRIYERSVRFIMLLAVRRLRHTRVRIKYSAGHGVFVSLPEQTLQADEVAAIEQEMRVICSEALPFRRKRFSREDAVRYFAEDGQADKVELLKRRVHDHFFMYECGGMWEYFYGIMADSTAVTDVFSLIPQSGGFVIQLPCAETPDQPVPYINRPKHLAIF